MKSIKTGVPLVLMFLLASAACERVDAQAQEQLARQVFADSGVRPTADSTFARLIRDLSEPGGYFDTDNLISNETSYLHAVSGLESLQIEGGAYIGVGPSQNFSYIAAIRPSVAFIVDIRRDNLLQHLFFKSLFLLSDTRAEYLALWLGKPVPEDLDAWRDASLEELVAYMRGDSARPGRRRRGSSSGSGRGRLPGLQHE